MTKDVYLAGASRTAIGAFCGVFEQTPAPILGSTAVKAALQRAGVKGDSVDEVIFGNVIGAGLGQNVARQVSLRANLSPGVGATTVNKVCGSGLKSVMLAAQAIQCGDAHVIVAGGTENMSRAPYLIEKARSGYRLGNGEIVDSLIRDGLWDVYNNVHMGACGDRCAEKYGLTRELILLPRVVEQGPKVMQKRLPDPEKLRLVAGIPGPVVPATAGANISENHKCGCACSPTFSHIRTVTTLAYCVQFILVN